MTLFFFFLISSLILLHYYVYKLLILKQLKLQPLVFTAITLPLLIYTLQSTLLMDEFFYK